MTFTLKGRQILIDDADWERVKDTTWFLGGGHSGEDYVMGHGADGSLLYLHRVLMNPPKGYVVDHRNRNRYDNRRCNLRNVTYLESNLNRGLNRNNTSGVKGVSWHSQRQKWRAHITVDHKSIHLGLFESFEDAQLARLKAEQLYWSGVPAMPEGYWERKAA